MQRFKNRANCWQNNNLVKYNSELGYAEEDILVLSPGTTFSAALIKPNIVYEIGIKLSKIKGLIVEK